MSKLAYENGLLVSKEDGKVVCVIADAILLRSIFVRASLYYDSIGLHKTAKREMERANCIAATEDFRG